MIATAPILAETEDTVTLRRADFERLIEALEDAEDHAALVQLAMREAALGPERARARYLTMDEAQRLWDGANPVRVWREKRGLSQRALAEQARISAPYLNEIETGKKPGSLVAMLAIARVLDVAVEDLAPLESREGG